MPPAEIVVVGSLNADLVVRVDRFPAPGETLRGRRFDVFPGGKGGNQAAAVARLGARVTMVGQVGSDAQGAWLRSALAEAGCDVQLVSVDDGTSSGVALITTDSSGQNEIVVVAGANGTFAAERLAPALMSLHAARVLLLQLEIPIETVERAAAEARSAGAVVVLDPAPAADIPDQLLALASIVTPNESELARLAGGRALDRPLRDDEVAETAGRLLARGAQAVLVKLGDRGARLVQSAGTRAWPAFEVEAVDTTAAGDAFNGALAVALAEGRPVEDAVPFACAAGAVSVARPGAQPSMPTRAEVDRLLDDT
jgi:ribokinase